MNHFGMSKSRYQEIASLECLLKRANRDFRLKLDHIPDHSAVMTEPRASHLIPTSREATQKINEFTSQPGSRVGYGHCEILSKFKENQLSVRFSVIECQNLQQCG